MSWKLIDRPMTVKVTKTLARKFAAMDPAPHDRPLSERRLQVYGRLITEGQFRPVTWASATCNETGGNYRVNGKHTSTLLAGLEPIPDFYVTIEEYECDNLSDVAQLYSTFDSKMMSRTTADINASFAGTVKELVEVPRSIVNLSVGALSYGEWGADAYAHQPAERAELMLDNVDAVLWLQKVLYGALEGDKRARRMALERIGVAAAMIATYRKSRAAATEFWIAVRDETGSTPGLPDRKLAKFLSTIAVDKAGSRAKKVQVAGTREIYVKCLHAWNAWRCGETSNLNYFVDKPAPAAR